MSLCDKIRGMLLGVGIGDALGMPVETYDPAKIQERFPECNGKVTTYLSPKGHKWFDAFPQGSTTDDTRLTLAVAEAIIRGKGNLHLAYHVDEHVNALQEGTAGWGGTTRQAIERLAKCPNPAISGLSSEKRGKGNGCAMKIAPLAARTVARLTQNLHRMSGDDHREFMNTTYNFAVKLALMTHNTVMAAQSAVVQLVALSYCLNPYCDYDSGDKFDIDQFIMLLIEGSAFAEKLAKANQSNPDSQTDLTARLSALHHYPAYDPARCREQFGGGGCYIGDSLPFTYMFFLRNPDSIDSLYDVVSAGGDTDTNGSMLGALLGALHGTKIFPKHLTDHLHGIEKILQTADRLVLSLGVQD